MICPYCGQENPDNIEQCGFCGGSLVQPGERPAMEMNVPAPAAEIAPISDKPAEQVSTPTPNRTPPPGGIYGNKIWWIVGCLVIVCLVLGCFAAVWAAYSYINSTGFLNPTPSTADFVPTQ